MAKGFEIDIRGFTADKIEKYAKKTFPKAVQASYVQAINRTARTIRSRAIRAISNASKIKPQKFIRQRTAISKANRKRVSGVIYFRYSPMPAEVVVGKSGVRWNRKMEGAKAKSRTYIGAFAAQPKSGKHTNRQRIYKRVGRTGNNRKDLRAQYIKLDKYAPILNTVTQRVVKQKFSNEFFTQLEFRVDKEIAKMNKGK